MRPAETSKGPEGLNAVLILDKPDGISSQKAVTGVKRILHVAKAGHTGTLDPFATGVLPICLNRATKASRFFLESDKVYEVNMLLGVETDTMDPTGEIISRTEVDHIRPQDVESIVPFLTGKIMQRPPAFSAVKVHGERAYKRARRGERVEPPPRCVEIKELTIIEIDIPRVAFRMWCGAGTYVRSLVSEWGSRLGCGAHVTALRRTKCGAFGIDTAVTLEQVEEAVRTNRLEAILIDVCRALDHLPLVKVPEKTAVDIRNGCQLEPRQLDDTQYETLKNGLPFRVVFGQSDLVAVMTPVYSTQTNRIERFRSLRVFEY